MDEIILSPAQSRAARALLDWSRAELAAKSGVSQATLADFESSKPRNLHSRTLEDIRRTLEAAGIIFIAENGEGPGVRLRKGTSP
jgi:transcriptional regulator with XRE-family HTH domain